MAEWPRQSQSTSHRFGGTIVWLCVVALFGCDGPVTPATPPTLPSHRDRKVSDPKSEKGPAEPRAIVVEPVATERDPEIPDLRGVSFVDVAHERGLRYIWPEQRRPLRILDAFGCGCAAFDADNDGWPDILLVDEPVPALFKNVEGRQFENITAESGLTAVQGAWKGCAIGDYDGDGLQDVLLTGYHRLALFKNMGNLRFEAATEAASLDATNHGHWGASAGFMDLDGDGWLDMVILNYVDFGPDSQQYCDMGLGILSGCTPKSYRPERGEIWRNTGHGTFELVPETAGMKQTTGVGLVLAFIDLDGDGRQDFYIGNDAVPADFLHNLGGLQFENIAVRAGLSVDDRNSNPVAAMGADWADYDHDGLLDLALTNFQNHSFVLFRNAGENQFVGASAAMGLTATTRNRLGFGTKWTDFDNDGWADLFFVNGHVYDNVAEVEEVHAQYRQPVFLFRNEQGRKFLDLAPALGPDVQRPMVGRGSATLDFNNDGRIDLLAVDYEGQVMLLENRTRPENYWLTLDLRAGAPNIFAYGARLVGRAGNQIWVAEVSPASSYLSSSDPRIHWGLGGVAQLDTLVIRWPSGKEQTLSDVLANQILRLAEDRP